MDRMLRESWPPMVRQAYAADDACFAHVDNRTRRRVTLLGGGPSGRCVARFRLQVAMMGRLSDALTGQPVDGPLSTAVTTLRASLEANLARDQPLLTAMGDGNRTRALSLLEQPLPPPVCIGAVNESIEARDAVAEDREGQADEPLMPFPFADC